VTAITNVFHNRESALDQPLGGDSLLGGADFRFRLEPVLFIVAVLAAAGFEEFVGALADLFFWRRKIGSFAGWFGALVIDLGFAAGLIACCEPLDVALQLIRFGAFL
jgi:hypothetical protein